jgi:SAM-dependent methyltransferase
MELAGRDDGGSKEASPSAQSVTEYLALRESVPGWFRDIDVTLFIGVDAMQRAYGARGDLLEIGVFYGRSSILLGYLARPGEALVTCDIFEDMQALSNEGQAEHGGMYRSLRREEFEWHYRRFHATLPTIIAAPSSTLDADAWAGRFRIIHIDGGHQYDVVREDIRLARKMLAPGGVVIFDDWCQPHCPGVGLAVWEDYLRGDLIPLALTDSKLYAKWGGSGVSVEALNNWIAGQPRIDSAQAYELGAHTVRRYVMKPALVESAPQPAPSSALRRLWRAVRSRT